MKRAIILALLLWATRARAVDVTGSVGGGYARTDSWSGVHADTTTWDWEADFAIAGSPFRPGLLQYLARVDYRAIRTAYAQLGSRSDAWGAQLQCSMLNDSPLPISLSFARMWTDFSSDADDKRTGSTVIDTYGGTAVFHVRRLPTLHVNLLRTDFENKTLGGPTVSGDSTNLTAGLAQATSNHTYQIDYSTGWNNGTYAESNYRSHFLNAQMTAQPSDDVRVRLNERYYLRDPQNDAPTNPRYDDNAFGAGVQWRPGQRLTSSYDYSYRRLLVESTGAPTIEEIGHTLAASTYFRWKPTLSVFGNLGFLYSLERNGGNDAESVAESVGGGALWQRRSGRNAYNLGGGGNVAVIEPLVGDTTLGWGANGSAGWTHTRERWRTTATYVVTFTDSPVAFAGYVLEQRLQLDADGVFVWRSVPFVWRGLFVATGGRRDDHLVGTSVYRSFSGMGSLGWKRYTASLGAGESDGLSMALAEPGISDGLFLPADYNTHTRYVTLTATESIDRGHLTLMQLARVMNADAPGRPDQYERSLVLSASYWLGLVTLSLEERLAVGGMGDTSQTVNTVFVRAMRTFGGSW